MDSNLTYEHWYNFKNDYIRSQLVKYHRGSQSALKKLNKDVLVSKVLSLLGVSAEDIEAQKAVVAKAKAAKEEAAAAAKAAGQPKGRGRPRTAVLARVAEIDSRGGDPVYPTEQPKVKAKVKGRAKATVRDPVTRVASTGPIEV